MTLGRNVYVRIINNTTRWYTNRFFQKMWRGLERRVDQRQTVNAVKSTWPK